jgi:hypothetical protein
MHHPNGCHMVHIFVFYLSSEEQRHDLNRLSHKMYFLRFGPLFDGKGKRWSLENKYLGSRDYSSMYLFLVLVLIVYGNRTNHPKIGISSHPDLLLLRLAMVIW